MFALVDCNNFFVSCERVFQPHLCNKPVLVLSSNDGCVVARSQEVKALGIKMGQPAFEIRDRVAQHNINVFSSNFSLYTDLSRRVMSILEHASPQVEIYSIDEAFLDCTHITPPTLKNHGQQLKQRVLQWTGIPISIGFAPTKTLAKIANFIAKKDSQTRGIFTLDQKNPILEHVQVQDIWGVGGQYTKKLKSYGIYTARDLQSCPRSWIRKHMGVMGERLVTELQGISCLTLETSPSPKKTLTVSRSFGKPITEKNLLNQAIALFLCTAAKKMRRHNLSTSALSIFIQTNRFQQKNYYSNSETVTFSQHTTDTAHLLKNARILLESLYRPGFKYVKAGVCLLNLRDERFQQKDLFTTNISQSEKTKFMHALDHINKKFGAHTITYATAMGPTPWLSKCTHRSKRFTTNWKELPEVS